MSNSFHELLDLLHRPTNKPVRLASANGDRFFAFPAEHDDLDQIITDLEGAHLWFEINESSFTGAEGRSSQQHITRLNALYVDVDFKGSGMGSPQQAMQLIDDLSAALGCPPAAIVNTGGGYQPYWPITNGKLESDEDRDLVARVLARWKEMCRTFARAAGGTVDSVFDLPRIFRVPGSYNVKDPNDPKLVTVDFPDGADTFTLGELQRIFDDYGIDAEPREILSGVVSAPAEWDWAHEDCRHVDTIRSEWRQRVPGARHPWLLAQAAMLYGMVRYGCVTEQTFSNMQVELDHRFQSLLAEEIPARQAQPNEVPAAYRWGAEQASMWSREKLADEMRGHIHDTFLDQMTRGVTTLRQGPIGATAPAQPRELPTNVTNLFTKQRVAGPTDPAASAMQGALALAFSANSHQRLAAVAHTDTGNAELFAQEIAGRYAYVPQLKGGDWYRWTGDRWKPDYANTHREAYKDLFTTRVIASTNPAEQTWLSGSLNAGKMTAAIKLAESIEHTRIDPFDMDRNMRELATPGGIVNLMTGEMRAMNPLVDLHTKLTCVGPDFSGPPEEFIRFLLWAFHGDVEMVAYMRRLLGLALIGELREQIFPVMLGPGANGKSTLFDILMGILGDYVIKMPPSFLVQEKGSQIPEALASIKGTRMALASEVPSNAKFDEELVKSISGDATITARRLYENSAPFANTTTLFGAFNHAPSVPVGGPSWWRRMRLIKMIAYIPDSQQDRMLRQRIVENEGGKVLAWLIQGTQEYLAGGEQQPSKVRAATAEYRLSEDDIARFIDTELLFVSDGTVDRKALYARYVAFMQTNRLFASMLSEPKFAREFLVLHPEARVVEQGVENVDVYGGFHLKSTTFAIPELPYVLP